MYVRGNKPAQVIADTAVGIKDGYHVFTTPQLQSAGLGYIIRWRTSNFFGTLFGAWNSPGSGWPDDSPIPSVHGVEFWRVSGMFLRENSAGLNVAIPDHLQGLETYSQWAALKDQALLPFEGDTGTALPPAHAYITIYHADVQVRYLMLADAASLASELDPLVQTVNISLLTMYPRPDAVVMPPVNFRHMIAFNMKPWGTCTTPSLIVPLGTLSTTALPAPGPATTPARTFALTFTKCPRPVFLPFAERDCGG